jgi:hypothetical protein
MTSTVTEMRYRVVLATRNCRSIVLAAILSAGLVASAAAQTHATGSTTCSAKGDVCEGNCRVRLRHSPDLTSCRQACSHRKMECLKTGTWRPLVSGHGQRRN